MNVWYYLCLILPPVIVFSAKPEDSAWWRAGRLLLAIAGLYGLIIFATYWQSLERDRLFQEFYHLFPECILNRCPNAPSGWPNGKFFTFLFFFGWLLAWGYVGIYEFIWRWRHRHAIRARGKAFKSQCASSLILLIAIPPILYMLTIISLIIYLYFKG